MTVDYEAINRKAVACARAAIDGEKLSSRPPGQAVFSAISGGHLYGFPSPDSDLDIRGCHVLPLNSIIGLREPRETFELMGEWVDGVEIDWVSHDLRKYLKLLMKNGGYILEQIFSPLVVHDGGHLEELRQLAAGAMTRNVYHHYHGFFRKQREAVATEPTLRAKSVLYLFRVVMSGIRILRAHEVETDIKVLNEEFQLSYLPQLWSAKSEKNEKLALPEEDRSRFVAEADRLRDVLENEFERTSLPHQAQNHADIDDFLIRLRRA